MALSGCLAGRTSSLLRQRLQPAANSFRCFTTQTPSYAPFARHARSSTPWRHVRAFSRTTALKSKSQEAPSAQAYLASGVIAGGRNLVDVSKVLVIGSGGLSIGQAGEFDYSGKCASDVGRLNFKTSSQTARRSMNPSNCSLIDKLLSTVQSQALRHSRL
jgi:carbamoyl-phosphate synthase large subunit